MKMYMIKLALSQKWAINRFDLEIRGLQEWTRSEEMALIEEYSQLINE
jgi:hypothetical protein